MNTPLRIWHPRANALPIIEVLDELSLALLQSRTAVLAAPPGAGKTTVVPLALLAAPWLADKRIIMLEPRRLAARSAARRMSWMLGEDVGNTVGYRVRNETRVGAHTRIEVVTEGVLTRILQNEPELMDYGVVIFDEFHERNLHGDVGLALTLQSQEVLRSDLRILVMSATLDTERVAAFLGNAPVVRSEGKIFPVHVRYHPPRTEQSMEVAVATAVKRALRENSGSILVFLPGIGEINRVSAQVAQLEELAGASLHTLHSSTPLEAQDDAIRPTAEGTRKVVFATSIAESSLTIDGVSVVVDSGTARVPRYSPRTGMTRLETVRVSRASSEQRAGRAGRTREGVAYRLWEEHEQQMLLSHWVPEILDADLVPLVLDLSVAGVRDPGELRWMDQPPAPAIAAARDLLQQLGALDAKFNATAHGHEMNRLSMHPRLAHMVLRSRALKLLPLACDVAAILEERDFVLFERHGEDVDLRTRVHLLNVWRKQSARGRAAPADTNEAVLSHVLREADRLRKETRAGDTHADERAAGLLLAMAYPDRVALRRDISSSRYVLRNGSGVMLPMSQALSASEMIVAADLDGRRPESKVWLAAPIDTADVLSHFADQIIEESRHEWDENTNSVKWVTREKLGALVLREAISPPRDRGEASEVAVAWLKREGVAQLPWSPTARSLRERVAFLRTRDATWPEMSDSKLAETLDEWLVPYLGEVVSLADLKKVDLYSCLLHQIPAAQRKDLERLAPTHIQVASGSRIAVDYSDPAAPQISVRLQELFGTAQSPTVYGKEVPVLLNLLSPARRPVQVTRDLASFWATSYQEIRKQLRARYPKHEWPEDAMGAKATAKVRKRG